jgi:hypothetical protein
MTHSTAGGIIRSRLRRRSEGCFDWTTYLDVLIQLYYPLQLRKRTKKNYWTMIITSSGVFCGPRDFVVGTPYSTDLSVPIGPASQSITWNRALKPSKWDQHPGRRPRRTMLPTFTYFPICLMQGPSLTQSLAPMYPI